MNVSRRDLMVAGAVTLGASGLLLSGSAVGAAAGDEAAVAQSIEALREGILKQDPFQVIDRDGVGELVRIGIERGRKTRPHLEVGICGEHGGDPDSVAFCHEIGLDYVSCSPFRVETARLAAGQAALGASESASK